MTFHLYVEFHTEYWQNACAMRDSKSNYCAL